MVTNASVNKLQATNKGIMEMKFHALLNLTLHGGEMQVLVCDHFTSEQSLKKGIPTYSTVVLNYVYIIIFYKLSTIKQNYFKETR
jgi:hypothetical protein